MFVPRPQQPPRPFNIIPQLRKIPYMPQMTQPTERVEQLFAVIMEGDINKILVTMSDKNVSPNILNSEGQSPIHVVLENNSSGLKENQKYEIIKLLIDNGASVSAYDKQNVTPLHLAAKFQYPKIVQLLLNSGAKSNVSDNLEMTPLHYAVQGNVETCKPVKRVKSLIPKNVNTITDVSTKELRNLSIQIINILMTNNFSQYLKHIENTFKVIGYIYPFDFEKMETGFMQEISNMLSNVSKNETEKEQFIKDKIIGLTNSFNEFVANKLNKTLKPMVIGPQNVDGWGPNVEPSDVRSFNRILPKETPKFVINQQSINFRENVDKLFKKYYDENLEKGLKKNAETIYKKCTDIYDKIHEIIQINTNAKVNRKYSTANGDKEPEKKFDINDDELKKLILNDDQTVLIYHEINMIGNVLLQCPDIGCLSGKDSPYLPNNKYTSSDIRLIRGDTRSQSKWAKDKIKKMTEYPLSNDADNTGIIQNIMIGPMIDKFNPAKWVGDVTKNNDTRYFQSDGPYQGLPYYYVSAYIFASLRIFLNIGVIVKNVTSMDKHFKESKYYYYAAQKILPILLLSCYNVGQYILYAESLISGILVKTDRMKDTFEGNYLSNVTHPYSYLIENCFLRSKQIMDLIREISDEMKATYVNCTKIVETFNETINLINKRGGVEQLVKMLESDFVDGTIANYNNMFDRPLRSFKSMPSDLQTYKGIFGSGDKLINRRIYYQNYCPYIDITTYASYVITNTQVATSLEGYRDYPDINSLITNIDIRQRNSVAGYLSTELYDVSSKKRMDLDEEIELKNRGYGLDESDIPNANIGPNGTENLESANSSKIGNYGVDVFGEGISKKIEAKPSIGETLDEYLNSIKYLLVQKMIEIYNDTDTTYKSIKLLNADLKDETEKTRDKYVESLKKNIQITDKKSILFTTVGKIADDLIMLQIKKSLYNNINNYVKKFTRNQIPTDDIKKIQKQISKVPFKADTGFSMNLKDLFNEIIKNYYGQAPFEDYNVLMHTIDVMEDEEKPPEQFRIYSANYTAIADNKEDQCYKIKPETIDFLLNKNADPNKKDYNGFSPIFYAIKNLHIDSVRKLLSSPKTTINSIKNNMGMTPYSYTLTTYSHHIGSLITDNTSVVQIIDRFTKPIYNQIKDNIEGNPDSKYNLIRYLDIIFPQLIIMFNNLLYFYAKSYINNWSHEEQQRIEQMLVANKLIANINNRLPILEGINNRIVRHSISLDALDKENQREIVSNTKSQKVLTELKSTQTNLNKEIIDTQIPLELDGPKFDKALSSIKSLDNKKNIVAKEITRLEQENNMQSQQQQNLSENVNDQIQNISGNFINKKDSYSMSDSYLGTEQNPSQVYRNIFNHVSAQYNDIFNNAITNTNSNTFGYEDYFLYNAIWKENISDNQKMQSVFNIHLLTALSQKQLIDKMGKIQTKRDIHIVNHDLGIIKELYRKVFAETINNYFYLPKEYEVKQNYVLFEVLEIITHIVKHTLCSSLYYAIIKVLTKYLLSLTPSELPQNNGISQIDLVNQTVQGIVNPNYGVAGKPEDAKLHNYVLVQMPKLLVKLKLDIYEDELDANKSIKSYDVFFNNIIGILTNNDVIAIGKDSTLITNLDNYVFKYYKDVFDQVIPKMKVVVDNYCRFILNEDRFLEIMEMMNQRLEKEISQ